MAAKVKKGKNYIDRDLGWNKLVKGIRKLSKGQAAAVGIQGTKASITEKEHEGMTNVELGAVMEFGTKDEKIPPRPFLAQTFDENLTEYKAEQVRLAAQFYGTGKSPKGPSLILAEKYRTDVIEAVKKNSFQEWAESTRRMKERQGKEGDVPLWDTGQLINSISSAWGDLRDFL